MIYPIVLGSCVGNECRPVKSDESAAVSRIRAQVRSEMSAALSRPAFAVAAPSRGEEEEGGDDDEVHDNAKVEANPFRPTPAVN